MIPAICIGIGLALIFHPGGVLWLQALQGSRIYKQPQTAYLALSSGRKVDIKLDDTLPIRDGACEVSFLDLPA
jgi:hypothetical protein